MPNRLALRVFHRFAHLQAVREPRAGGMKRLERRFRFSGPRADAQREARAMNPPVIRVKVRTEELKSGTRFETQPADGAVLRQPAADRAKIGARHLPFHFPSIFLN